MKAMWKGAISFGLISIPVKMYLATQEKSISFHQLHDADMGRIHYSRICSKCGQEVPYENIVRGYEYEKDRYVVLDEEDLEAVPVASSRNIDLVEFVDLDEIDPVYFQKSYYLVPEEIGSKAYHLLRQALETGRKVGIGKIAFREKEHLAALRVQDRVLVLETMFWPDEIRQPDFVEIEKEIAARPQELEMARSLIDNLTEKWDPQSFQDEYRKALLEVIDRKITGEEVEVPAPAPEAEVIDIMEALRASVEAAKKARTTGNGGRTEPAASSDGHQRESEARPESGAGRQRRKAS